jgi:hypothetical protein
MESVKKKHVVENFFFPGESPKRDFRRIGELIPLLFRREKQNSIAHILTNDFLCLLFFSFLRKNNGANGALN